MAIGEEQLTTWSKQGAITQSKETYAAIRNVLEKDDSPYKKKGKTCRVFLQGSYGNDTNVYKESDVDVVIELRESTFYNDLSKLSSPEVSAFKATYQDATYNFGDFKADVLGHLQTHFKDLVKPGNKAICILPGSGRRKADVVVAVEHRRYRTFPIAPGDFEAGIFLIATDNARIVNYPKQHSANLTSKHQETSEWFKPMVRILKNMRNSLVANAALSDGVAPSYYIEGLLYNVPPEMFGKSYGDSFVNCFNWIWNADRAQFLCANREYSLLNGPANVTWTAANCDAFLNALRTSWTKGC